MPRAHSAHDDGTGVATTTDHGDIRKWVEARSGQPAKVAGTDSRTGGGILRIDFNEPEASLTEIGWDEFFRTFESRKLAFLYEEETGDGERSYFNKFVGRRDSED